MDPTFWLERWQQGQTGFHLETVHPLLERHWPSCVGQAQGPVMVPLSGKSVDLHYLSARGHAVTGIELSDIAIRQFFEGFGQIPESRRVSCGRVYEKDRIRLFEGDFFDLDRESLGEIAFVYDRAALIAMNPSQQTHYAAQLRALTRPAPIFLITLEYDPCAMDGPPFTVSAQDVETLFGSHYQIHCLEEGDVIDLNPALKARGLHSLKEAAWWLVPRSGN